MTFEIHIVRDVAICVPLYLSLRVLLEAHLPLTLVEPFGVSLVVCINQQLFEFAIVGFGTDLVRGVRRSQVRLLKGSGLVSGQRSVALCGRQRPRSVSRFRSESEHVRLRRGVSNIESTKAKRVHTDLEGRMVGGSSIGPRRTV
jgi:hypothetical protein